SRTLTRTCWPRCSRAGTRSSRADSRSSDRGRSSTRWCRRGRRAAIPRPTSRARGDRAPPTTWSPPMAPAAGSCRAMSLALSKARPAAGWFRAPLLALALLCAAGLAADTALALSYRYLPLDLTISRAVQAVDWGPVAATFGVYAWIAGFTQLAIALALLVLVFVVDRRAAPLMVCGALTGALYQGLNWVVA